MDFIHDQKVKTPLGVGRFQAPFAVVDGKGQAVTVGILVRLPVNDETSRALKMSNCLTPRARLNGLWVFQAEEVLAC